MNLEDKIKDIEKEISELKKGMLSLIKEITEGFKEITRAIVGDIKHPEPIKVDCERIFI